MKRPDDPSPPTNTRLLIGLAARLLVVLVVAWIVDATGFGGAADGVLRQQYYGLRGQRDSTQRVILVAIDAPTVTAWGPPPWRADQLAGVFAAIARGKPAVVGAVDETVRLMAAGDRLPEGVIAGRAALELDAETVDTAALRVTDDRAPAGDPTVTHKLLAASGINFASSAISINFVGKRGLPMLSAVDVARGNIPSESFAGKLVVVGITAQPFAGLVPTPIGPLTPAQVQAHALSSVADGVEWMTVPGWLRWMLMAVLCAAAMILVHHLATVGATIAMTAMVLGILVFDYVLFATSTARFGAAVPVIAALLASAVERIHERIVVGRHVLEIGHWTRQWMMLDSMRTEVPDDEPGYWLRVAGLARLYLGCTSTIVAELPEGGSHLKLRVINGTTAKLIGERRRDVRRSPYRKAHLTLGPVWHDRFMNDDKGTATLLVPLVVRTTLVGFWIVNFPTRDAVAAAHMALIKTLAREIAMAIDRRRTATTPARSVTAVGRVLGAGRLTIDLEAVRRSFEAHTQNQQDLLTLGESMPFGVFVATLWGEIRYMNTAMKLVCKQEGLDPSSTTDSLPDVLCRLTGFHVNEVHQHLRKLVQELEELHLRGRDRIDRGGRDFVLSWLKPIAGDPADAEQLILVCALPPRALERVTAGDRAATDRPNVVSARASSPRPFDDHAVTTPRLKVELDPEAAESRPLQVLAQGTPAFSNEVPLATGLRLPLAPDATLSFRQADDDHFDEVTFVAAGASARSTRSLPVVPERLPGGDTVKSDKTMPMFKVKIDDPR